MSKRSTGVQHSMQGVFVFVLLGLFAVMSTLMVLLGAQMYRGTVEHSTANNDRRVLSAYVRSMIRAEDRLDGVKAENHDGIDALALYEDYDGEMYVTWLYVYEGSLCELFTEAGYGFDPEEGTPICPAQRFEAVVEDGLVTVNMIDGSGEARTVQVALRSAQ